MDVKQHVSSKTRRQKRKGERKLKKQRRDCFHRHKPVPTKESLEAEELERQQQEMMRRQKLKEKLEKKEERLEMEQAEKEAEKEKKRQLEIINKEDHKMLRELERKLKIKPKLNTWPSAFKNDHLDYILNYKDEAELLKSYVESGKDKKSRKRLHSSDEEDSLTSDEDNLSESQGDSDDNSDDKEKTRGSDEGSDMDLDDDESDEDDEEEEDEEEDRDGEQDETEEEDEEVSEDNESDEQDAGEKLLKGKLTSKKNAEVKGILSEPKSKDKHGKKTVSFGEKSKLSEEPKKKQSGSLTEDIYGRLRDKEGNVVKDSTAFVPPGRRLQLQQKDSKGLDTLKIQISRIINRLHDKQMQMFSSQMENLFVSHSRADVSEVLTNELIKDSIKNELIKRNRAMDSMLLLAIIHTKVGNEVSAVFLEALVSKFDEIFQTLDDSDGAVTENQFENAVLLLTHLYQFKVIDCHLVYSIIEKLISRFYVKDIHSLTLLWKEIGFCLRKDNPKVFQNIYLKTTEMVSTVDKKYAHKRVLSMQLSEMLLAVKSNNPKKLQMDDEEELESRQKLLKTILSDSVNAPLHVSLDDLLSAERKGKWWLVGSAWAGSVESASTHDADEKTTDSVPQVDGVNLVKLAQKLHMNTDIRKKILFTIVTSNNYREAFERVLKLSLTRRQDKDVLHVISTLCKRGKGNPFYTHLAEAFRKYHKRFKKLPGISENRSAVEEMDFDT